MPESKDIPGPIGEARGGPPPLWGVLWLIVGGEGVFSFPEPAGLCTLGAKEAAEVSILGGLFSEQCSRATSRELVSGGVGWGGCAWARVGRQHTLAGTITREVGRVSWACVGIMDDILNPYGLRRWGRVAIRGPVVHDCDCRDCRKRGPSWGEGDPKDVGRRTKYNKLWRVLVSLS